MIKKILIALIVAPIVVAVLALAAALVAINYPTLVVNETTLKMAERHLHPLGIKVQWQHVETRCKSHGFMDETVGVAFDKLCVEMRPTVEKACFDKFEVAARYRFEGLTPKIVEVGPLDIRGGDVVVRAPKGKKEEKKDAAFSIPKLIVPDWLKQIRMHTINMDIENVEAHVDETTYRIKANVGGKDDKKGRPQTITAKVSIRCHSDRPTHSTTLRASSVRERRNPLLEEQQKARDPSRHTTGGHATSLGMTSFDIKATLASPSAFEKDDWELQATVDAKLAPTTKATVDAKLNATGTGGIDHIVEAKFSQGKITGDAKLQGTLTETSFSTVLSAGANSLSDVVRSVQLPKCTIDLVAEDLRANRGNLKLACPVDIVLKKFTLPSPELQKMYRPPDHVRVDLSAQASTFFVPDPDQKTSGTVKIHIDPFKGKLVRTRGDMKIDFAGIPSKPIDSWKITSDMDVDFIIDDVAHLIAVLATTKYPAPAPFNKFTGPIEFSLQGKVSSATEFGQFPVNLTTNLKSPDQVIEMKSNGELNVGFIEKKAIGKTELKLDVDLTNVQLQLPNVAVAALPRVTPDGRIILNPEKEKKKKAKPEIPFDYDVTVKTPPTNPIRILSNITPKYIPIHVDVNLTNDTMDGYVLISDFPIKLFSRSAILEKLKLTLEHPVDKSKVEGRLSMQFPELKLIVNMAGTIEHPVITLNSDPEMSEGDMISTLLYGEPMSNIDSDQASSVSSMNAAMTDRAMALTSFFMLGSTPIQSIAYNPETKMFSARVRLGKRTSFGVGASQSEKSAGLRTRLGKGFSITTGVDKNDDDDGAAANAMIEWSKRF